LSAAFAAMITRLNQFNQQQARQLAAACVRLDGWTRAMADRPKTPR
jgi:hypothetical protein